MYCIYIYGNLSVKSSTSIQQIPGYSTKKTPFISDPFSKVPGGALMFRDNDICLGPAIIWARDKPRCQGFRNETTTPGFL